MRRIQKNKFNRSGTATIELAVSLPVLMLVVLGALQTVSSIYLKQSLLVASYEGCRVGIEHAGSHQSITNRVNQILSEREIINPTITITPSDFSTLQTGDLITVQVEAPLVGNTFFGTSFIPTAAASADCVMMCE
jgi:hypothetical protein